jgi:hypothetical protein
MAWVTIELPDDVPPMFASTPEGFAAEFRLAAAIEWYRQRRVSQGTGAEVAGTSRQAFLEALFRTVISPVSSTICTANIASLCP